MHSVTAQNISEDSLISQVMTHLQALIPEGKHVLIYGASVRGQWLCRHIQEQELWTVEGFIDQKVKQVCGLPSVSLDQVKLNASKQVVIVCTSPKNYGVIKEQLLKRDAQMMIIPMVDITNEALNQNLDMQLFPRVCRGEVDSVVRSIKVIIESQPASGSTFVCNALLKSLNLEKAYCVNDFPLRHKIYPQVTYRKKGCAEQDLLLFCHYFQSLEYHAAQAAPIVKIITYPFDAYYSRLSRIYKEDIDHHTPRKDFFLSEDNCLWQKYAQLLERNAYWISKVKTDTCLRFEDWFIQPEENVKKLKSLFPQLSIADFPVEAKPHRLYFSDDYAAKMSKGVFLSIWNHFQDQIVQFWPEKISAIEEALHQYAS